MLGPYVHLAHWLFQPYFQWGSHVCLMMYVKYVCSTPSFSSVEAYTSWANAMTHWCLSMVVVVAVNVCDHRCEGANMANEL